LRNGLGFENRLMAADVQLSGNPEPPAAGKGLPPVTPPSGAFIVQLFLVPGIIVAVAVFILMGFSWLVGGESSTDKLLQRLENPNADIYWRAANELAQRIHRDDQLAADPKVALRLAGLLRKALDELDRAEQSLLESEHKDHRQDLRTKRKHVEFLIPCLGHLSIPTGVPLLTEIALRTKGDLKTSVLLRRQAVWALATLGDNLKRFSKLDPEQAAAVREALRQAEGGTTEQAQWAGLTLGYLDGTQRNIGVIEALARCAHTRGDPTDDVFLRELVAEALGFWEGDDAANALAEQTLLALARDDGHGVRIEITETD
jgi:hypothetical protein